MRELLRQLRLQLRRDHRQQVGVVGQERPLQIVAVEHDHVVPRAELHRAAEMRFIQRRFPSGRLNSTRFGLRRARAAAADLHDPGEADVDQHGRLVFVRRAATRTARAFVAAFDNVDLFRTGELLVARHAFQRVAERARIERGDRDRIVALHAFFAAELEPDAGIAADCR